ncbi:MAG: P1 family peptidase [Thermodesulfobacteriota bacterium]|nr:P1 family peptidase [Thermodesulfobacteriota bacterium]
MNNSTLTAIDGVRVGHATDLQGGTGLSMIVFDSPAIGAADISGMATSSRQMDSLGMMHPGSQINALCLAGGSAFGLGAATGAVSYLEDKGVGMDLFVARLPIVPCAVLYDLSFMDAHARPTEAMAYDACDSASSAPVEQGCVGAGTGATCGKLRGTNNATKSGLGSALVEEGIKVAALVVANPFGDILDHKGRIIAGARDGNGFIDSHACILHGEVKKQMGAPGNTTLCVIVTDAKMDKVMAMQVARMAGRGLASRISPYNTPVDGDMVLCFSVGQKQAHPLHLGVMASQAATDALMNAVKHARGMGGLPSFSG